MNLIQILVSHKKWLNNDKDGHRADIGSANLHYANLSNANLSGDNLRYANLSFANLRYANLSGADLREADLSGADLREADLRGANFRYADFRYANLSGADFRGADLRESDLRDADLPRSMKLLQSGQWTAIVMPDAIAIGCQQHSVSRWMAFCDEEIEQMHPNALKWWKENKSLVMAIHASLEMEQ